MTSPHVKQGSSQIAQKKCKLQSPSEGDASVRTFDHSPLARGDLSRPRQRRRIILRPEDLADDSSSDEDAVEKRRSVARQQALPLPRRTNGCLNGRPMSMALEAGAPIHSSVHQSTMSSKPINNRVEQVKHINPTIPHRLPPAYSPINPNLMSNRSSNRSGSYGLAGDSSLSGGSATGDGKKGSSASDRTSLVARIQSPDGMDVDTCSSLGSDLARTHSSSDRDRGAEHYQLDSTHNPKQMGLFNRPVPTPSDKRSSLWAYPACDGVPTGDGRGERSVIARRLYQLDRRHRNEQGAVVQDQGDGSDETRRTGSSCAGPQEGNDQPRDQDCGSALRRASESVPCTPPPHARITLEGFHSPAPDTPCPMPDDRNVQPSGRISGISQRPTRLCSSASSTEERTLRTGRSLFLQHKRELDSGRFRSGLQGLQQGRLRPSKNYQRLGRIASMPVRMNPLGDYRGARAASLASVPLTGGSSIGPSRSRDRLMGSASTSALLTGYHRVIEGCAAGPGWLDSGSSAVMPGPRESTVEQIPPGQSRSTESSGIFERVTKASTSAWPGSTKERQAESMTSRSLSNHKGTKGLSGHTLRDNRAMTARTSSVAIAPSRPMTSSAARLPVPRRSDRKLKLHRSRSIRSVSPLLEELKARAAINRDLFDRPDVTAPLLAPPPVTGTRPRIKPLTRSSSAASNAPLFTGASSGHDAHDGSNSKTWIDHRYRPPGPFARLGRDFSMPQRIAVEGRPRELGNPIDTDENAFSSERWDRYTTEMGSTSTPRRDRRRSNDIEDDPTSSQQDRGRPSPAPRSHPSPPSSDSSRAVGASSSLTTEPDDLAAQLTTVLLDPYDEEDHGSSSAEGEIMARGYHLGLDEGLGSLDSGDETGSMTWGMGIGSGSGFGTASVLGSAAAATSSPGWGAPSSPDGYSGSMFLPGDSSPGFALSGDVSKGSGVEL